MNRRKFLIGLPLLAGGALVSYPAIQWIRRNTAPDLAYLLRSGNLLASVVDVIIPKTDSPSASECGVHDFIIKMIRDCTDTITQNKFIEGLKSLENYGPDSFGKSFVECTAGEKQKILQHIADQEKPWQGLPGKIQKRYLGSPFVVTLKQYCVKGYCTSEGGATLALRYAHIPSRYIPCEPYSAGEKAWATS